MKILSPTQKALISNLVNTAKMQFGEEYFISEKDIAEKYGVSVEDVIFVEKEAIPFEFDVKDAKERRVRILNNLYKNGLDFYKEVGTSKADFTDAIIVNEEGKLLLLKRSEYTEIEPGKWCLPGGHAEKFIGLERNVLKEIKEETGLSILECQPISIKKIKNNKKIYYFFCTIPLNSEVILNEKEHSNYKFFTLTELREMPAEDYIYDLKEYLLNMIEAK